MTHSRLAMRVSDERGMALPTALVILLLIGLIGSASVFLTLGDTNIAYLYGSSNRASAAAEAGLTHAVAVLQEELLGFDPDEDGPMDDAVMDLGWPLEGSVGEYEYSVTISRDSFDFDANGTDEPVSYAYTGQGYNGNDKGQPVYVLVSEAERGAHRATETLRVTKWILDVTFDAAVTLNTAKDIRIESDFLLSGIDTDLDGEEVNPNSAASTGVCDENKAAVHLTTPHELKNPGGADPTPDLRVKENQGDLDGNKIFEDLDPNFVTQDSVVDWQGVEDVLDIPEGSLDGFQRTAAEHNANLPDSLSGVTWITDDIGTGQCFSAAGCSSIQGRGLLIVHNPLFNPREHDEDDPLYDAAKADDPLYAPAEIEKVDGGTFRGIIIADIIPDHFLSTFTIYGTLVVLGHINDPPNKGFRFKINSGTGTVIYSCEAVEEASDIGVIRLSWMAD